jgi:hypothetical protein
MGGSRFNANQSKVSETPPKKNHCTVTSIIAAMQETEVGGSRSNSGPKQKARPYLKSKLKQKEFEGMA